MTLADYQEMMRKRSAPPSPLVYKVSPSHVVVVHGMLRGVAGGAAVTASAWRFRSKSS